MTAGISTVLIHDKHELHKENTMKKLILLFTIVPALAIILSSCISTPRKEKTVQQEIVPEQQKEAGQIPEKAEKNVQKDPPDVVFVKNLQESLNKNDMQGALASFETMPDSLKNDTDLQILHASILVSAGRGKEAAAIGDALQAKDGSNVSVLELNSQIAAANGDKNKENVLIKQILTVDPYNTSANIQKAGQQVLWHKYKPAYDYYKKALKNEPDNPDALFGCAQMAYYLDNIPEAKATLQKILDKDSKNAMALAYMGKIAAENENNLQATKYIQEAISSDPGNYDFYLDLGTYQAKQENYNEAESAWTTAITIDPTYFLAYAYRAGLYNELKKYKESLADYYSVVKTNPQYYYAYEEIGILEWHEQNWEKARKGFKKALEFSKDNYSYKLMIAATYLKENNIEGCKSFLKNAMRNMDTTSIEYAMLRLYNDQGGINAENYILSKLDKIEKTTPRGKMWYYMGLYYEIKGSEQIATEFFTKIMNMQTPMFFEYELAEWSLGK